MLIYTCVFIGLVGGVGRAPLLQPMKANLPKKKEKKEKTNNQKTTRKEVTVHFLFYFWQNAKGGQSCIRHDGGICVSLEPPPRLVRTPRITRPRSLRRTSPLSRASLCLAPPPSYDRPSQQTNPIFLCPLTAVVFLRSIQGHGPPPPRW